MRKNLFDSGYFLGALVLAVVFMTLVGMWPNAPIHAAPLQNFPPPSLAAFTPTGQATIAATTSSANVALPTSGASTPIASVVIVTNESSTATMFVLLGTSNAVAVTTTTGYPIAPNGIAVLTIKSNTYIAAIGSAAGNVGVSTGY